MAYVLENNDEEIIKIDVKARPVNNRANIELIDYISKEFSVGKKNVKIINGASTPFKLLKIEK